MTEHDYKKEAERLWDIIDNVSTAADIAKPDPSNLYYKLVKTAIKDYMKVIKSDGYNLTWEDS